jgi:hypothetical protein
MNETVVHATEQFLKDQLSKATSRVSELEQSHQRLAQRDYSSAAQLQTVIDGMHAWTVNALEEREISETNAQEIADICGFELTKEVEAEISVTYFLTLQVPAGESAEDVINDIDFDAIVYDTDRITDVSSSVDSVNF